MILADLTRPHLGADISTSTTLAVRRYAGGAARIVRMLTRPRLRSAFSAARLLRTPFARARASMRWSSDLTGAVLNCFVEADMAAIISTRGRALQQPPKKKVLPSGGFARDDLSCR